MSDIERFKSQVKAFCSERDWDQFHDIKELAIGVSTESAELLEIFRFRSKTECDALVTEPASRESIEDELADVFFFVVRMCEKYGLDLDEAFARKMEKNARKYPVDKSRGSNRKYDQL